ncbi:MAG TPA: undecaprenyl-diphosphate phosphatase, partial [bacterium]|nr:undecaprenyl-diphosphate phosphatase [bacterium]
VGLKREDATRFSFLLGLPAIFGAGIFELRPLLHGGLASGGGGLGLGLGLLVAGVSGYWSIGFLLRYLKTRSTAVFIAYRLVLGALIIAAAWQGWIS